MGERETRSFTVDALSQFKANWDQTQRELMLRGVVDEKSSAHNQVDGQQKNGSGFLRTERNHSMKGLSREKLNCFGVKLGSRFHAKVSLPIRAPEKMT